MSEQQVIVGDCREVLRGMEAESVQVCVTSPPYWNLRDYGVDGQLGLEPTPEEYLATMVDVFREVRRVLRKDGTLWLNMGDKTIEKNLLGMPWRLAFALQADGWRLACDIIWHKLDPTPVSAEFRPVPAHDYLFLFAKQQRYYYDGDAIRETTGREATEQEYLEADGHNTPTGTLAEGIGVGFGAAKSRLTHPSGRGKRSVWSIAKQPFNGWTETVRVRPAPFCDGVSDGTMRITSPNCRDHAGQPDRIPKAFRDERVAAELIRILRKHGHPDQEQTGESAETRTTPCGCSSLSSSGCSDQSCDCSANPHNKQSRKTGLVPVTTQPCTLSAQSPRHTGDKSEAHGSSAQGHDSDESTSLAGCVSGAMETGLSGQTPDRSVDIDKCSCSYYTYITEKSSHFATFPEKLVEPCIKAGTSDRGCCVKCKAPWKRVTEKTRVPTRPGRDNVSDTTGMANRDEQRHVTEVRTTGWEPGCGCKARNTLSPPKPVPCTVIDPFLGSGTTLVVARKLGRDGVGIELSEEYAEMARKRIANPHPEPEVLDVDGQLTFGGAPDG